MSSTRKYEVFTHRTGGKKIKQKTATSSVHENTGERILLEKQRKKSIT